MGKCAGGAAWECPGMSQDTRMVWEQDYDVGWLLGGVATVRDLGWTGSLGGMLCCGAQADCG